MTTKQMCESTARFRLVRRGTRPRPAAEGPRRTFAHMPSGSAWASVLASRAGIHYGWIVVAITFVVLLVTAGLRALPSVVIKPLESEFGWDRAGVSLAIAVSWIVVGLAGPFSGWLVDRVGPRLAMILGLALTVVGTAAMMVMSTLWELNLWWGFVAGLGTGTLSLVVGAAVATRWFAVRHGLAVGILGAGSSAGTLIFVPIMMSLTLAFGWRAAVGLGVALLAVVVLPLVVLLMRDTPSEVGLGLYGADREPAPAASPDGPLTSLSEALRTLDFWLLAGSFFICGFTSTGLIGTHLVPHAVEHGFTDGVAAGAMALLGAMNVVGTIGSGYLTDRFNPRLLLATYYGFRALSLVLLPLVADVTGLMLFAILFGLDFIATVPPTVALTADRFGRRSVGPLFGWIFCGHQIGAAAATYFGGITHVWVGDYTPAFLAFVAVGLSLRISRAPASPPLPDRPLPLQPAWKSTWMR
jgi:MFS family permease